LDQAEERRILGRTTALLERALAAAVRRVVEGEEDAALGVVRLQLERPFEVRLGRRPVALVEERTLRAR
jgi:hypothetical protein